MTKFSNNILTGGGGHPPATKTLASMLQTVTSSFTLITRDENPKALIICGKPVLNLTNINFKISDKHRNHPTKFFRGEPCPPLGPPGPPGHGATGSAPSLKFVMKYAK